MKTRCCGVNDTAMKIRYGRADFELEDVATSGDTAR